MCMCKPGVLLPIARRCSHSRCKHFLQWREGGMALSRNTAAVAAMLLFFSSRRRHTRFDCDWSSDVCSSDLYLLAHVRLAAYGYHFYEVSNACRDQRRSRHNSAYWSGRPYLGLGPAAHSYDGRARRWNVAAWPAYARAVADGRSPVESREVLTPEQRELERVYLALRTEAGVSLSTLHHPPPASTTRWVDRGWAEVRDGRLVCTPQGWLRLDSLVRDLTELGVVA